MKILARVLAMAEDEVLGMVSPRALRDIKRDDPQPKLMAFVVGQEGEARPKMVGIGATIQRWFRSAIEALTDKLNLGIPAYHEHGEMNSSEGRKPIGEIVGKALRHVEGLLSSIAVAYIYPQYRDLPLDIASIEAQILIPEDAREFDVTDVDVQAVTGVALSNSANNNPAFPGATLLAQLQAFAGGNDRAQGGSEMKQTLEELKKAVQESGFKPSDVFEAKDLTKDPFIVEHVKEEKQSEYFARKRNQAEFDAEREKFEKTLKDLQDKVTSYETGALQGEAKTALDRVLTERPALKADPRLAKFVQKAFDKTFKPTAKDKLQAELNTFVDAQVTEYQDLFGAPASDKKGKGGKDEKTGDGQGQAAGGESNPNDLLDPKNNDLIPA